MSETKTYTIKVEANIVVSSEIEIEASSLEEAEQKAAGQFETDLEISTGDSEFEEVDVDFISVDGTGEDEE